MYSNKYYCLLKKNLIYKFLSLKWKKSISKYFNPRSQSQPIYKYFINLIFLIYIFNLFQDFDQKKKKNGDSNQYTFILDC